MALIVSDYTSPTDKSAPLARLEAAVTPNGGEAWITGGHLFTSAWRLSLPMTVAGQTLVMAMVISAIAGGGALLARPLLTAFGA